MLYRVLPSFIPQSSLVQWSSPVVRHILSSQSSIHPGHLLHREPSSTSMCCSLHAPIGTTTVAGHSFSPPLSVFFSLSLYFKIFKSMRNCSTQFTNLFLLCCFFCFHFISKASYLLRNCFTYFTNLFLF